MLQLFPDAWCRLPCFGQTSTQRWLQYNLWSCREGIRCLQTLGDTFVFSPRVNRQNLHSGLNSTKRTTSSSGLGKDVNGRCGHPFANQASQVGCITIYDRAETEYAAYKHLATHSSSRDGSTKKTSFRLKINWTDNFKLRSGQIRHRAWLPSFSQTIIPSRFQYNISSLRDGICGL
jgi:hypothetical protein